MPVTDAYAEQYSSRERLRFAAIGLGVYAAGYLLWQRWALPYWSAFVSDAPCRELWGVPGISVVFYTLLVGVPLAMALLTAIIVSRRGLRVLRDGQSPFRGEKVFRRTRIKRGRLARLIGWTQLLAPLGFLAIALWGAPIAKNLIIEISSTPASCEARPATLD